MVRTQNLFINFPNIGKKKKWVSEWTENIHKSHTMYTPCVDEAISVAVTHTNQTNKQTNLNN